MGVETLTGIREQLVEHPPQCEYRGPSVHAAAAYVHFPELPAGRGRSFEDQYLEARAREIQSSS
jgi:hypothetical protein